MLTKFSQYLEVPTSAFSFHVAALNKNLFESNTVFYVSKIGSLVWRDQLEGETKSPVIKGFVEKCPNLQKLYHEISMTPLAEIYSVP